MSCWQWVDALETNSQQTSSSEVKAWQHTTALCHCEHGVARGTCCISYSVYIKQPCNNLQMKSNMKFLTSDKHGTWGCASQIPQVHSISHTKLAPHAPGWVVIQVNFDPIQEIGPQVGGEPLSRVGTLSQDYSIKIYIPVNIRCVNTHLP